MADYGDAQVTIEEVDAPDGTAPLTLTLAGRDAPTGGRGSGGAFEIAPGVRETAFYNPGATTPTRHRHGTKWQPMTFKGMWEAKFFADENHAQNQLTLALAMLDRDRTLRVSWGTFAWVAHWASNGVVCKPETYHDVAYELTFDLDGPETTVFQDQAGSTPTTQGDLAQEATDAGLALAQAAADTTQGYPAAPLPPGTVDPSGVGPVAAALVTGALVALLSQADALTAALATLDDVRALGARDLGRVLAQAHAVGAQAAALRLTAGAVDAAPGASPLAAVAWQHARAVALETAHRLEGVAVEAAARVAAQRAAGTVGEVYYTSAGDTLESVARARLGDELRAPEIAALNRLADFAPAAGQRLLLPR